MLNTLPVATVRVRHSRSTPYIVATSLVLLSSVLFGCGGIGAVIFAKENGGPPKANRGKESKVFDVVCNDSFEASGGQTATGSQAGTYAVGCTYQGKPMPWKSLGVFHAAPMASGKWDKYRANVTLRASKIGCPGVAIRTTEPTENQGGEAVGAWCIEL